MKPIRSLLSSLLARRLSRLAALLLLALALPAMAAALLTVSDAERRGERLYIYFLQGRFDDVIRLISHFWRRNQEIAARGASEQLLNEEGEDKVAWYFTVELVRTLGSLADNLRRGDSNRYERALSKLMALDRLAIRTFGDDLSLLVTLLRQVAEAYGENSIYRPLRLLGELNPARLAKLEGYGRTQFHRGRGILWTSQLHGLQRLLQDRSFALCTPTGSGKTLVANLALVKELLLVNQDIEDPLALYLVPSRALAGEVEAKLTAELGRDLIITGLYGGADWGITDYWLNADRPTVLIATVEKADALMRYLGPLLVRRLRLLIVDEAHQVVPNVDDRINADFAEHSERSIRLESFVSRLLSQSPDVVRIALTAVAGGAASPVARWIEGRNDASAVGTDYRSTRQIVGTFETQSATAGRMELDLLNGRPLFVRGRDEPVYIRLRTPPMPLLSAALRKSIYRFNALDVLWTALNLSEERRILISVAQQPEQIMGWYAQALALPAWQPALSFTPPADGADRERYEATRAACIDYCGDDSYELALL
ncbi:MAG: DEAD/DEAH box helicase, partial [Betaproteobacteria bacterium]|nr:DEAD/DEAH box helicase [Betaproteobacteria bacterium]